MKNLVLYKGYHSQEAHQAFADAQINNDLILFLPPTLNNFSFAKHLSYNEVIFKGELWDSKPSLKSNENDLLNNQATCGVFTSGTSETAKLVLYSNENLQTSINGITELFKKINVNNIYCYPQPFHTFGLTLGFACSQIKDWSLQFCDEKYSTLHHEKWLKELTESTLTLGTPTHFYDLIHWVKENNITPKESASCIIGGAKVKKQLWLDIKKYLNIKNPSIGYGATEASPGVTHLAPGQEPKEDGEIGQPLPHVKTSITNEGLLFSGPNLCLATIDSNGLTQPKDFLLPDLIDIRNEDDIWIYKARTKWFINRGGEKFSLEKIEQEVLKLTDIEILCFPIQDERLGEELAMIVKSDFSDFENNKEILFSSLKKTFLRDFNSNYALPISEIPINENSKKDRKKALEYFCKNYSKK